MTTEDTEYLKEMFNKEITKLRREVYENCYNDLCEDFSENEVKRSWLYFEAIPIMDSINLRSFEMLLECCDMARNYEANKMK